MINIDLPSTMVYSSGETPRSSFRFPALRRPRGIHVLAELCGEALGEWQAEDPSFCGNPWENPMEKWWIVLGKMALCRIKPGTHGGLTKKHRVLYVLIVDILVG